MNATHGQPTTAAPGSEGGSATTPSPSPVEHVTGLLDGAGLSPRAEVGGRAADDPADAEDDDSQLEDGCVAQVPAWQPMLHLERCPTHGDSEGEWCISG